MLFLGQLWNGNMISQLVMSVKALKSIALALKVTVNALYCRSRIPLVQFISILSPVQSKNPTNITKNPHKEQPQTLKHATTLLPTPTTCTIRNSANQLCCKEENKRSLFRCFPDSSFHVQCLVHQAGCISWFGWCVQLLVLVQCCAGTADLVLGMEPGQLTLNSYKQQPSCNFDLFVFNNFSNNGRKY